LELHQFTEDSLSLEDVFIMTARAGARQADE
jgi:hypothetical protein